MSSKGAVNMITDVTLCYREKAKQYEQRQILQALKRLPIDSIEMSIPIWENISWGQLPHHRYALRITEYKDIKKYQGFSRYILSDDLKHMAGYKQSIIFNADGKKIQQRITGDAGLSVIQMQDVFKQWHKTEIISFEPLDLSGQATALAVSWLESGGQNIVTAFNGLGCHAPLEEVLLTMHLENIKKIEGNLDFTVLQKILPISANKPIVGKSIFAVESGIHVDGILKNPQLYEPYPPELVGGQRQIVLGNISGKNSIEAKLKELKINYAQIDNAAILKRVKEKSRMLCRAITDKEFFDLIGWKGNV